MSNECDAVINLFEAITSRSKRIERELKQSDKDKIAKLEERIENAHDEIGRLRMLIKLNRMFDR